MCWSITTANAPKVDPYASKAKIHHIIRDLARKEGVAVLMISDDVPELTGNCNRIHVMHDGRFVAEFAGADMTEDAINDSLKALK